LSARSKSSSGMNSSCCTLSVSAPEDGSTRWTSPVGPPAEYRCVYGGGRDMYDEVAAVNVRDNPLINLMSGQWDVLIGTVLTC
jgi:hypothetical protein